MGQGGELILLVLLVGLLAVGGYIVYDRLPREAVPLIPQFQTPPPVMQNYTPSVQFYPNMRFTDNRISYSIESGCTASKRATAMGAFTILEEKTPLSFYEAADAEISVICSELPPSAEKKGHFIAGEGGPTEILNGSDYSIIVAGTFSLYRDETCKTPHIALHELLHVLGFDHNTNPASILYPTLDCDQTLDAYLVDEINRLYSVPSKPDLELVSASGTKAGKYISFEVTVVNRGLADVADTSLWVYADDRFVKEFDLDAIPIASRKTLTVGNFSVGRSTQRITFEIDGAHTIDELREDNNQQELRLQLN